MNKVLQINLGGYALTIDEDAYQHLATYLDNIRQRLSGREERDEIMRDIETRLGEIISSRLGARAIVSLSDVEAAIEVMGKPEDFGGEESSASTSKSSEKTPRHHGRRLYRDESDAVIGGVCSGLSAYFGLSDPVWIRLIFILLALISFGFWVPAYLLLWILVPPARTAAERLAMRGEMPNVENIVREVEQGAERFARRAEAFGRQAGVQLGASSGNLASGCLAFVARFFKGAAIFLAIMLVTVLGTVWVAGTIAFFTARPSISFLNPLPTEAAYLGFVNLFFLVGIPVVSLVIWLMRLIFRFQAPAWLGMGMTVLWVLNLISLSGLASWAAAQYQEEGSVTRTLDLGQVTSDTLYVRFDPKTAPSSFYEDGDLNIYPYPRQWRISVPRVEVEQSLSGRFEGAYTLYARGHSEAAAREHAAGFTLDATLSGNTLTLPGSLPLTKGGWRAQRAEVQLRVPVGKYVVFEKGLHRRVKANYADAIHSVRDNPGGVFQMTINGLVCTYCSTSNIDTEPNGPVDYFILKGTLDVDITHDDNFGLYCPDNTPGAEKISVVRRGRTLVLSAAKGDSPIRCSIHTPVFTSLVASGQGQVSIRGFEEGRSSITAKGPVRVRRLYKSNDLKAVLDNKATLELIGEGNQLEAVLSDEARLEASTWRVESATVTAANGSRASVHAEESATVRSDASSTVETTGQGAIRRF